jgi:hypothetical protein
MEKSKLTKTENGETGDQQSQENAHYFLWHQGDRSQRIRPGKPNSQFRILLRHFVANVWTCAKSSTVHHLTLPFSPNRTWLSSTAHPTFLFPRLKIKVKGWYFDRLSWSRQNCSWCWTPSQNTASKMQTNKKTNSMVWVRERTIPTKRPPLVGEVIANFCA